MKNVFVRTENNYDTDIASIETGIEFKGISRTQQNQKEESDINTIVRRFGLTGELPKNVRVPTYGDFTGAVDYQTSMNQIIAAKEAFMEMPAEIRKRFHNDPGELVDFVADPKNEDEARKLGILIEKEVKVQPQPTQPVQTASPIVT